MAQDLFCPVLEDLLAGLIPHLDGALPIHCENGVGRVLHRLPVAGLALAQPFLCAPARLPGLCLAQLALHSRNQACQVVFHDIIVGTCLHGRHGTVLSDSAGHDDERQIKAHFLHPFQGMECAKVRHGIVGDDDFPGLFGDRSLKGIEGVNAL